MGSRAVLTMAALAAALAALAVVGCGPAGAPVAIPSSTPPQPGATVSPAPGSALDVFVVDTDVTGPLAARLAVQAHPPGRLVPSEPLQPLLTFEASEETSIWDLVTFSEAISSESGSGSLGVTGTCGSGWTAGGERVDADPCDAASPIARVTAEAPVTLGVTLFPRTDEGAAAPGRYRAVIPLDPDDEASRLVLVYDLVTAGSRPLPGEASPGATGSLTVVLDEVPDPFHRATTPPLRSVVEDPYGRSAGEREWEWEAVRAAAGDDPEPAWTVSVPLGPWRVVALALGRDGDALVRCAGGQTVLTAEDPHQRLALVFDAVGTDGRCLHR